MDTKDVKTIAMYGPSISDPSKVVNRDVPVCDEQAYKAAGYVRGSIVVDDEIHEDGTPKVTYTEADAAEQAEVKPKGRGKK